MTPRVRIRPFSRLLVVFVALLAMLGVAACGNTGGSGSTESQAPAADAGTRTVTDSMGRSVEVPATVESVATISDALVEEVMYALDVEAKIVAVGGLVIARDSEFDLETVSGETVKYTGGKNPAYYLMPELADVPSVMSESQINFESLASADPDVLIIHSGCCSLNWREDETQMSQTLDKLDSLGVPTVVVHGPAWSGKPSVDDLKAAIEVIGDVFDKNSQAQELGVTIEQEMNLISERTQDVPEAERTKVMLFGLSPRVRSEGGAGNTYGAKDVHTYMLEEFAHAKNVFTSDVTTVPLNTEQVLALDPDVFVLPTANGYHPPRELLESPNYANLADMRAIKEKRVAALPYSPRNCDQRLEMPVNVMVMAQAAYPDKFADVDLGEWMVDYFQKIYGVNETDANGIIDALWMDWTRD